VVVVSGQTTEAGSASNFLEEGIVPSPPHNLKEVLDTTKSVGTITAPEQQREIIASYNLIDADKRIIIVPGWPIMWTGCAVPFTLQPGDAFVQLVDRYCAAVPIPDATTFRYRRRDT